MTVEVIMCSYDYRLENWKICEPVPCKYCMWMYKSLSKKVPSRGQIKKLIPQFLDHMRDIFDIH